MATTNCKFCGQPFDYTPIVGLPFDLKPTVCDSCDLKLKEAEESKVKAERYQKWKDICPVIYQNTDPNHPGMPAAHKLAKILNWAGPKGLVVLGKTRKGKTRVMWLLVKRLMLEGKAVKAYLAGDLAGEISAVHSCDPAAALAWREEIVDCDILFLDDLGKFKLTERVEDELFTIIERRTSNNKPILFTTNYTGDGLETRFSPDRGAPLVERIREFCESVSI